MITETETDAEMSTYGFGIHAAPARHVDRNFNLQMKIFSLYLSVCDIMR